LKLFIMRHGRAEDRYVWPGTDASRPLTTDGLEKTGAVLRALQKHASRKLNPELILSSPLVRAWQTACLARDILHIPLDEEPALACGSTLDRLARVFSERELPETVMLVGHEPDLGALAGDLEGTGGFRPFKKAGVALLEGEFARGGMKLRWMVRPKDALKESDTVE
jgi:phosphohistidine phosphatase